MHRTTRMTAALAAVALAATGTAMNGASAAARPAPKYVVTAGLVTPLTAAVASNGTAYISEDFAGKIVKKAPNKPRKVIFSAKQGTSVGAVSFRAGVLTFALNPQQGTNRFIKTMSGGQVSTLANVGAYEAQNNPDSGVTYGFRHISKKCAAQLPKNFGPPNYPGQVDSNPYGTAVTGTETYVADAGGNDILAITPDGAIRTVAVLPAAPLKVTKKTAQGLGLPKCTVGLTYWFEAVPTDVEVRKGLLYVSALSGGPEDPSLGKRSRVFTVNPTSGHVVQIAGHLGGATGLALNDRGAIFVAELFVNQITRITPNTFDQKVWRKVPKPAAVEFANNTVYATTRVLPPNQANGRLVRFAP